MKNPFHAILAIFIDTLYYLADRLIKLGQWIYSKLLNLVRNIIPYFKKREHKITQSNLKAMSIRITNDIENKNYSELKGILNTEATNGRVVSGIFNTDTGEFLDEEDMHVVEYEALDQETQMQFGDNDLLIIT